MPYLINLWDLAFLNDFFFLSPPEDAFQVSVCSSGFTTQTKYMAECLYQKQLFFSIHFMIQEVFNIWGRVTDMCTVKINTACSTSQTYFLPPMRGDLFLEIHGH